MERNGAKRSGAECSHECGIVHYECRITQIRRHQPYDIDNPMEIVIAFYLLIFEVSKKKINFFPKLVNYFHKLCMIGSELCMIGKSCTVREYISNHDLYGIDQFRMVCESS